MNINNNITKEVNKGFVLPFTMLISVLILFVMMGSMSLLSKQLYFSRLYKDSQLAYYAADDAINCTIAIDDTYVGSDGLGIFPSEPYSAGNNVPVQDADGNPSYPYIATTLANVNAKNGTSITADQIKCGQATIFDTALNSTSKFQVSPVDYVYNYKNPQTGVAEVENGQTSTFSMRMDLGIDPNDTFGVKHLYRCARITVNKTQSFRQIIAQGYSLCDGQSNAVERAIVNTTISQ